MKYSEKIQPLFGKLFLNGNLVHPRSAHTFPVLNPADQQLIGKAAEGSAEDVNEAVESAWKALKEGPWKEMSNFQRGKILYKFAQLVQQNIQWLSYFQSLNNGKPKKVCENEDIPVSAQIFRYFAGEADKITGSVLTVTKPFFGFTKKQPIGVVGQIIPWNYPIMMFTWKVAPALAAGCTVVVKPAEQTPFTALFMGLLLKQAGLPDGVLNIVTGHGTTGAALAQHPKVSKVSFTGSTQVGYLVMKNSHKHSLRPVTLELGGKSANIILPDVDIKKACQQACIVFGNNGQSCIAGSRTFVHEKIYDQFIEQAIAFAKGIRVGDPQSEQVDQGAIVSKQQFQRILSYIQIGKNQGAKLVCGGNRIGQKGYFIAPTIFTQVQDHMRIAKEEIFGPVMSVFKWNDEEQVIRRANQLNYGLGAGIVTNDISKALKFVQRLQAGTVYVNCYDYAQGSTPFGGVKDSGFGKDLGKEGLQGYLTTKTVLIKPM